jgi:hypothetical protein
VNEYRRIEQFNQQLDRMLRSLPPGKGKLTIEDRRALVLAKRAARIDLSQQSKAQKKLRQHLEELAMIRLPHTSSLSLNLLFKPGRLSWIGLVVLIQLVVGSIFGNMSIFSHTPISLQSIGCVTPPASSFITLSPEVNPTGWIARNSSGSESRLAQENPRPVPTPLAPPNNTVFPQDTSAPLATPLLVKNPVEP